MWRFFYATRAEGLSWTTFASSCTQSELVQYLKERRLYVNEPVDVEEDL